MAMATPIMTEFKTNTYAGIEMKGMQRMVVIGAAGSVRAQSTCELGGLFPGVHRVNIEVPTRNGDGCSCVRGARSPCWTSRNEGHPVANKRCEDEGDESDVT